MLCWPYLKRNIIFRIIFLLLISLVIVYNLNFLSSIDQFLNSSQKHLISCYFEEKHDNSLLELNPEEVTKNSIFFVETSCNHKKGINLSLRQGCAIESAANLNPNLNIFVLFVAPSFISDESEIINRFKIYSNVNLRYINFVKYSHNTPLQDFVASNTIATSQWPVSHASDLLRFLTLWKFGGTYLDLDVVLMKSLEGLSNFASIESNTSVASLVLNFDVDKIGRTVSNTSISDFASNYYANDWGYNGPGVITRTLEKICNTNLVTDMNKQKCQGFMVFGTEAFCPIGWTDWRLYFNTNTSDEVMVKLKDSIGIHVWNLHSKHTAINIGSKQPYGLVAEKYCPVIFSMAKQKLNKTKPRSVQLFYLGRYVAKDLINLVTTPIPLETFEDQRTTTPGLVDSGPAYLSPWMILLLFAIIRGSYL